jgi:sialic acid synthase SpsE
MSDGMDGIRFVAEFTTNHLGNYNLLMKMTAKAAEVGCSLIKMQKKDVYSFYTPEKLQTPYESPYGKTYAEYRETFEFGEDDFSRFARVCEMRGIPWFATVQDIPSLEFLLGFDLDVYKLASINVKNLELIAAIQSNVSKDKELVVSVGGATLEEIERVLKKLADYRRITVLHCVAEYPCEFSNLRLGNITELIRLFATPNIEIGYSGHEEGVVPSIVAAGLGARMVERHFCVSRTSFAHHIECSLEPGEYAELINTVKNASSLDELLFHEKLLPPAAMKSHFGMSEIERDFLLAGRYGKKYIKGKNKIHE